MTTTDRMLTVIAELRDLLDITQTRLTSEPEIPEEKLRQVESILVQFSRWRPDVMYLTGPGGYNPQPAYEKCDTCGHYRLP